MDSNNTSKNSNNELDIRDIAGYLLSKLWIIALVVLCFAIIAFLWTTFFVTEKYDSTSKLFIINTSTEGSQSTQDWSIGKQLSKTSKELILGDYCAKVADALNNHDPNAELGENDINLSDILNKDDKILPSNMSFSAYYKSRTGKDKITESDIRSSLKVVSDDETCTISVTASTIDPKLSAAIANTTLELFGDHIRGFMVDTIATDVYNSGKVVNTPSNANVTRNAILAGIVGAVIVCAVLVVIFIFDDKIKTPDDIEKQLNISVLGTIPEIDEV